MDPLDQEQRRKQVGRQSYIKWRMSDLPAVYQELMPFSDRFVDLRDAEQLIRQQWVVDLQTCAGKPRDTLATTSFLLDWSGVTEGDLRKFLCESDGQPNDR